MSGLSKTRQAFTIVELLVVIAIIGVLIGMLLPAVQQARESGRHTQCVNNIKQLGYGMQNYESSFRYLPHNQGTTDTIATCTGTYPKVDGYSWIAEILPYIEETNVFNRIKFDKELDYNDAPYNNLQAAQQKITILICPSDSNTSGLTTNSLMYPNQPVGSTNYKACAGSNWAYSVDPATGNLTPATPPYPPLAPNNKGRNHDNPDGLDHGNGIICRNNLDLTTDPNAKPILTADFDIRDGGSHTFAIGEAVVGLCNYNAWYWYNGTTATCAIPLNYKNPAAIMPNPNDWTYTYAFRSRHPMGANFCMCDGSAKFVTETVDPAVYQAQATIDAGELFNDD
jgi:prepilin-type N-terminal cleavage/methylation domain-containing protein/prepilin-type processing-associated H-X9-DG protein